MNKCVAAGVWSKNKKASEESVAVIKARTNAFITISKLAQEK